MSFKVILAVDNELTNSKTKEIFLKQTVQIEEQGGKGGEGDCLSIKSGRKIWFNAPASQFTVGQIIPVTWELLAADYKITTVTTKAGRTILKIDL
jgi:hypothetical protein